MRMLKKQGMTSSVRVISRQTSWIDPRIRMLITERVASAAGESAGCETELSGVEMESGTVCRLSWWGAFGGAGLGACFDALLEIDHPSGPEAAVAVGPAVGDLLEGDGVKEVKSLSTFLAGNDQPGGFEHPQVLHH